MLAHLTARTYAGRPLLADWDTAAGLWRILRRAFPRALAAVLMPNHPHLVTDVPDLEVARVRLAHVLGAATRRARAGRLRPEPRWEPVPVVMPIPDVRHLRRVVRYVVLNPCRADLVRDPLEWPWSTHRDVLGAVGDPWVAAPRLAAALAASPRGFAARHHGYVSADPSCRVEGTPAPRPAAPSDLPRHSLARLLAAAAAATRAHSTAITARTSTRLLFVQLAARHGWNDTRLLARACGVSPQAVVKLRQRRVAELVRAGDLCLGDDRLCARWPAEA